MKASIGRRQSALAVAALALVALAVALAPGAQASGTFSSCANKKVNFQIEVEEGKKSPYSVVIKTISVKGTTCAAAYEFLRESYANYGSGDGGYPQGYKCKGGQFDVPLGYIPEICSKGSKTIKYSTQGG
jgi:hypothetical protein